MLTTVAVACRAVACRTVACRTAARRTVACRTVARRAVARRTVSTMRSQCCFSLLLATLLLAALACCCCLWLCCCSCFWWWLPSPACCWSLVSLPCALSPRPTRKTRVFAAPAAFNWTKALPVVPVTQNPKLIILRAVVKVSDIWADHGQSAGRAGGGYWQVNGQHALLSVVEEPIKATTADFGRAWC